MDIKIGDVIIFNRERFMKRPKNGDYTERHRVGKVTAISSDVINVEVFKNSLSLSKDKYQISKNEVIEVNPNLEDYNI